MNKLWIFEKDNDILEDLPNLEKNLKVDYSNKLD